MAGGRFVSRLPFVFTRTKTTSAQHVAARPIDPTFEKLMEGYKHLFKVFAVQELVLASPDGSLPLPHLASVAQRFHLNRGAAHFVRAFPRVFSILYDASAVQPIVRLTPAAVALASAESAAAASAGADVVDRLWRLLTMSTSRSLPLRGIFKVWRELGLPDDFEDSIIARNPAIFVLRPNPREASTHILELVDKVQSPNFTPAVDEWRLQERGREGSKADEMELKFGFKQGFPPGMRLTKDFRSRTKEWQRLPYAGPYEASAVTANRRTSRARMKSLEKRAVAIAHEFLSLTVEKMVEVEKISHFRKWFGIDLNIMDLFLDHPGIFYLSTKGKRHTVFLREAYDRGRLAISNPIYVSRMQLLELVLMRRRGMGSNATDSPRRMRLPSEEYAEKSVDDSCSEDV